MRKVALTLAVASGCMMCPGVVIGQDGGEYALPSVAAVGVDTSTRMDTAAKAQIMAASAFVKSAQTAVYFPPHSAKLNETAKTTLDAQAAFMRAHPNYHFTLWGHADVAGEQGQGNTLSSARAKAVYDYLLDQDIPAAQITPQKARGFRDSWPGMGPALRRRVVTELSHIESIE